jgi:serine/threonine protein kinase
MTLYASPGPGRRYQVHRPVGQGGFGTVYLADMLGDNGFVRAVALKVLNRNVAASGEIARRFRDEARVLGLLRHRAIVQVDGLVYLGDRQALVMEYIDGADLGRLMALGPMPVGPSLEVVGEVANALDVAFHQPGPDGRPLGLLHRDVKPSNIRLTPAGEVKVLDFGVARAEFTEREAVTKSYLLGSNGYMAPERFEGEDGSPSDIYSLGVVLLEMLTGGSFGSTSIRPQKLLDRIDTALEEAGGFQAQVADLVRAMMSFEPSDRPTAGEVERRAWELHRALQLERLRDWARTTVAEAAAKPVPPTADDLSGQMLKETVSSATLIEKPPLERPPDPSEPPLHKPFPMSSVSAVLEEPTESPNLPLVDDFSLGGSPVDDPPVDDFPVDEWDDEQPTVVEVTRGIGRRPKQLGAPNLAASATPVSFVPPPPIPPVAESRSIERSPRPRPRPLPRTTEAEPSITPRLVGVGTAVGVGLAVMAGAALFLSQQSALQLDETPAVEAQASLDETPTKVVYEGVMPTATEGAVVMAGDVSAVRLVASNGQRHRGGLLAPGTYLVSVDFGEGARMADRFELAAGERIIVDCSVSAQACSVFRDE